MATANPENVVFNIPNQLTAARLALSIAVFVLIPLQLYLPALIVFALAAGPIGSMAGGLAEYKRVTKLGLSGPFVDKILICGTFIFLAAEGLGHLCLDGGRRDGPKEMLVSAGHGGAEWRAFPQDGGKLKMVFGAHG
jgi:hypothetical protein